MPYEPLGSAFRVAVGRNHWKARSGTGVAEHPGDCLNPLSLGARVAGGQRNLPIKLMAAGAIEDELSLGLAVREPSKPGRTTRRPILAGPGG
jgi:hypothetical protein